MTIREVEGLKEKLGGADGPVSIVRGVYYGVERGEVFGVVGVFVTSRRRHTIFDCDWSSDVCSSDLNHLMPEWAMVDSGSSHSVLALHVADKLGVAYDKKIESRRTGTGVVPFTYYVPRGSRSEERRVGEECRSRWSP